MHRWQYEHLPVEENAADGVKVLQVLWEWSSICRAVEHHLILMSLFPSESSQAVSAENARRRRIRVHTQRGDEEEAEVTVLLLLMQQTSFSSSVSSPFLRLFLTSIRSECQMKPQKDFSFLVFFSLSVLWVFLQASSEVFVPTVSFLPLN